MSFFRRGAAASAETLAEAIAADSAGVLLASGGWSDLGPGPPSGTLLASRGVGGSDVGATFDAALFNSTDSRGSSAGRNRGKGGDATVLWWWATGLRKPLRNFCAIPDARPAGGWIDGHSARSGAAGHSTK
jgi:hypothetical protein